MPSSRGTGRNLADETTAYQALLEGHRNDPDDDQLYEDMLKARRMMEVAWLEREAGGMAA